MRFILVILFTYLSLFTSAQTVNAVKSAIKKLVSDDQLKNASISFYAVDTDSNKVIAAIEEQKSLVPASIMKLVTTATALDIYGPDKRFNTIIEYSGNIDSNKVLNGDIYIVGSGDPCLGSKRYTKHYQDFINNWANKIVQLGIDSINGRIIGDASLFNSQMIPSTWIWGDLGNYYGAGPSGLSIYENMCTIDFSSGERGDSTEIICVTPYVPNLTFDNYVKSMATKKDKSYIFGAPYQENRIIKGGIPVNKKHFSVKGSVPDPAYLAAFELDMRLRSLGVKIALLSSTVDQLDVYRSLENKLITNLESPRLADIINKTNTYSINLYAEHLINHLGVRYNKIGDATSGTEFTSMFWKNKGMNLAGFYMNDGSGLSRFNALTTQHMVYILKYMKSSKYSKEFIKSLPVAGKTGTLRSVGRGTAASGRVMAKSGYMTRVRSYAGYVITKNNRNIAFALIVNNYNCTPYQMKKKMEKIMIKLAEIKE